MQNIIAFRFANSIFALVITLFAFNYSASAAPDGKALFQSNCAACHNPLKDATGPALKGVDARVPSKEWLHKWIKNSAAVIASGDKYANDLYAKWNKTAMTAFPNLSDEEIDAIIAYTNSVEPPKKDDGGATAATSATKDTSGSKWIYSMVTLILVALAFILWRVNSGLRRVANDKDGVPNEKEIPFYRNKVVIAMTVILVFILAGYWITNGAVEMGRQQNYMPEQPG